MSVISHKEEEILKTIALYRFATAEDIANLLFSSKSLTHVREVLLRLSGGADQAHNAPLCRFRMPDERGGNPQRIYTLSKTGRDLTYASWHFRTDKTLGFAYLKHALTLTRFLIAAEIFARNRGFSLTVRTCYELSPLVQKQTLPALPDAWLLFHKVKKHPFIIEIDRGTEYQQKFREHVNVRIEFIKSGRYQEIFGIPAVSVCYVTNSCERRDAMVLWLRDMELGAWERIFWFANIPPQAIYTSGLFASPLWYQSAKSNPLPLLPP